MMGRRSKNNERMAEVMDRIWPLRRGNKTKDRMPFAKIAATLNSEGLPTRQGGQWKPGTVYQIVSEHRPQLTGQSSYVCTRN